MACTADYRAKLLVSGAVAALLVTGAQPAFAQIEEIVVTARKKEETLQSAPVAVSAFTSEAIAERGITDMNDIARFTPGLSFSQAFGRSTDRPVIRGQSNVLAGVQFGVESGTAYFVDGIYYPGDIQSFDLGQVERVEIIKGPQSALYGRNTYAGAINYITKTPSNKWEGSAKAVLAEYDEREFAAGIRGPIMGDKVFLGLNARYYEYGGQYKNQLTGSKVGNEESRSVSGTLFIQATENLTARLRGQYARDSDGPLALFLQGAEFNNCKPGFRSIQYRQNPPVLLPGSFQGVRPATDNPNQYFCGVIKPRPDLIRLNTDPLPNGTPDGTAYDGVLNKQYLTSLIVDYDVGGSGYVVTSQTGWRWNENLFGTDSDHSDANIFPNATGRFTTANPLGTEAFLANTNRDLVRDYSQELRIASPQNRSLRGILGGYYYYQRFENVDLTFAAPTNGIPFGTNGSNLDTVENTAAFALLSYDITSQLTVTGEVRWAVETKQTINWGAANARVFDRQEKYQSVTPRFTVDYEINDDALVYAIFAQGVKPGGLNGTAGLSVNRPTYLQEESDNYELGTKLTWLGGRLQTNVSGYWIDATNVQLTTALVNPTGGAVTSIATNQGAAEIKGLEFEANAVPIDGLTLGVSYSWTDAQFTKGCDPDEYVLNSGGLRMPAGYTGPLCDISGRRLPLGSEHKFSANVGWEAPFQGDYRYFINADYTYESSKYVQVHNLAETGDTHLVGLRGGLRSDNWQFTGFVRNLLNEDSVPLATRWLEYRYGAGTGATRNIPAAQAALADTGAPRAFFTALRKGRTFGLEARYTF